MSCRTTPVIAIDGPAASGKSSTAQAVADRLGLPHIDSGALYRTATWLMLAEALRGAEAIVAGLDAAEISLVRCGNRVEIRTAAGPAEAAIRAPAVTARVSEVAAMPPVRDWVDRRLRQAVRDWGGAVMDGRDIGTVVFPDAILKVFLTASPAARAERRLRQLRPGGHAVTDLAAETSRLATRDELDSSREVAPLRPAPDARVLDTTQLGFTAQVEQIVVWAGQVGLSDR